IEGHDVELVARLQRLREGADAHLGSALACPARNLRIRLDPDRAPSAPHRRAQEPAVRGPDVEQAAASGTDAVESVENGREVPLAKALERILAGALVDHRVRPRLADPRREGRGLESALAAAQDPLRVS